jgi:hypothetical protein
LAGDVFVNQRLAVGNEGGDLGFDGAAYQMRFMLFHIEEIGNGSLFFQRWLLADASQPTFERFRLGAGNGLDQAEDALGLFCPGIILSRQVRS